MWDGPEATEQPTWMAMAELVFTLFFMVDYLMHFYAAESRLAYLTSFFALIDLVTIVPVRVASRACGCGTPLTAGAPAVR